MWKAKAKAKKDKAMVRRAKERIPKVRERKEREISRKAQRVTPTAKAKGKTRRANELGFAIHVVWPGAYGKGAKHCWRKCTARRVSAALINRDKDYRIAENEPAVFDLHEKHYEK